MRVTNARSIVIHGTTSFDFKFRLYELITNILIEDHANSKWDKREVS